VHECRWTVATQFIAVLPLDGCHSVCAVRAGRLSASLCGARWTVVRQFVRCPNWKGVTLLSLLLTLFSALVGRLAGALSMVQKMVCGGVFQFVPMIGNTGASRKRYQRPRLDVNKQAIK
jgi:hypothetical protein